MHNIKMNELNRTKNYGLFNLLFFNRSIIISHIRSMMRSIIAFGVIRPVVVVKTKIIDGTSRLYIVDGQHLFLALKELELEIPYIIHHIKTKDEMAQFLGTINSTAKTLKNEDYLNMFADIGYDDYITLRNKRKQGGIKSISLLHDFYKLTCGKKITKSFKQGEFHIVDEELTLELLRVYNQCIDLFPKSQGWNYMVRDPFAYFIIEHRILDEERLRKAVLQWKKDYCGSGTIDLKEDERLRDTLYEYYFDRNE